MSATPYSDAWRERTRERMADLGVDAHDVAIATLGAAMEALASGDVSLELAGPIDELLDKLEEQREAAALELPDVVEVQPGNKRRPHLARRVDVDLGPLCDCDVVLHGGRP